MAVIGWPCIDRHGVVGHQAMSFQILDIVLYSRTGKIRRIPLRAGKVNIITGGNRAGKTALIDIVDYCLGSSECHIPSGQVFQTISWYGLRLLIRDGQMFVARRAPASTGEASPDFFFNLGGELDIPEHGELTGLTSRDTLIALLSKGAGITENMHVPPEGQTRYPLSATIRHALFYTFQPQYEIISPRYLFHNQGEQQIPQAIKDTLPYFLGAVSDDQIAKRSKLKQLKDQLRRKEAQLAEAEAIRGEGLNKALILLTEAQESGLIDPDLRLDTWEAALERLRGAAQVPIDPNVDFDASGGMVETLLRERNELSREHRRLKERIAALNSLAAYERGFVRESEEQASRLKCVELFENTSADPEPKCPLCHSPIAEFVPAASAIRSAFEQIDNQLKGMSTGAHHLQGAIDRLRTMALAVKQKIALNRDRLDALRKTDSQLDQLLDQAARRAHVLGRLSLYLESVPDLEDPHDLTAAVDKLKASVSALSDELSEELTRERINSILNQLGSRMTGLAANLALENSDHPLRFDIFRLTLVSDTPEGAFPVRRIGGGENWVGHHLVVHLAFHEWFSKQNRPVPRFLFLDQPSQVYFPADFDPVESPERVGESDREKLSRLFKFIIDFVNALPIGFQIIITEHADLTEDWFQEAVVQRWRGDEKLVPLEWLE
jgi:Protein of unknown function (DUF3732)